ncbi:hypothetical protein B0T25DRAFT_570473 [Lasiosphaeria hispida]|uniref:Uncharacterized protein n=1 Tax=Lasiosphaeria hispida TaxID=260671 RepID=A0AAJ0HFG8_9PEZI|nr:hypothetical protein B0T25DRAFT_570473 [Lasiosphaeria hispida]
MASNRRSHNAQDEKLREWKRLLHQSSLIPCPSPTVVSHFFQLGLELVNGDPGPAQEAIKLSASNDGLLFIKDIADRHVHAAQAAGDRPGLRLWTTEIKPLFQLLF